jgi:hypothetical protein
MTPSDRATLERYEKLIYSQCRRDVPPMGKITPSPFATPVRGSYMAYASMALILRGKPLPGITEPAAAPPSVGPLPAADGTQICRTAFQALGWYVLFRKSGQPLDQRSAAVDATFSRLIDSQLDSGEFLLATRSDNPEPHWYHELVLLHAMSVFALHSGREDAWRAVERSAEFHLNESQPDHATTEPWAVFAFAHYYDTLPLADHMLHAVKMQYPKSPTQFPWLLLRDALYCLRKELGITR